MVNGRSIAVDARVVIDGADDKTPIPSAIRACPRNYNSAELTVLEHEDYDMFKKWLAEGDRDALKCFTGSEEIPADIDAHHFVAKFLYQEFDSVITIAVIEKDAIVALVRYFNVLNF